MIVNIKRVKLTRSDGRLKGIQFHDEDTSINMGVTIK